jgi:hypothetical protein
MARKDMKAKLGSSIKAEEKAVKGRYDKFERADAALASTKTPGVASSTAGDNGKVIRDSFTMPGADYDAISRIKRRARHLDFDTNKSEILRAGLAVLDKMPDRELLKVFEGLTKVKPGRPASKSGVEK